MSGLKSGVKRALLPEPRLLVSKRDENYNYNFKMKAGEKGISWLKRGALFLSLFYYSFCAFTSENRNHVVGKIIADYAKEDQLFEVNIFRSNNLTGYPVHTVISDQSGIFRFHLNTLENVIVEIEGIQGKGRIFISSEKLSDTIKIAYPVIETIIFLHTNDHHFDINLWKEFSARVNEIREIHQDVFLLEAGDIFVRHRFRWTVNGMPSEEPLLWYRNRTKQMIALRNELGYDVMTPGNHELDYIRNYTRRALERAAFPLIAANIHVSTRRLPRFEDYIHLQTNTGRTISVLGLSVHNARKRGVVQKDIFETADAYMFLRDEADVFLALTHIGLNNDRKLAGMFPQLDLIIGGHSHSLLEEAIMVNNVLIAQAGGNPHVVSDDHPVYLGKVTVILENGKVVSKKGKVYTIAAK
jgi:hypothetical protein